MKKDVNKGVVFNFLEGNYTSIQRKSLEQWLHDPDNEELFYQYLNEYESLNPQYPVEVEDRLEELKANLGQLKPSKRQIGGSMSFWRKNRFWFGSAAAILVIGLLSGIYMVNDAPVNQALSENMPVTKLSVKVNDGDRPLTVILPDKSSVILQPKGQISYSEKEFGLNRREVFFQGEGFFEVLKDAESPFIVYTEQYTTKVLGTSFTLKTSSNSEDNEVIVKTGKVAVFKGKNDSVKKVEGLKPNILLSANQRIRFDNKPDTELTPAKTNRADLIEPIEKMTFEFDDKPVAEVFQLLEEAYHVTIHYDREFMKNCRITAFLADEPLYEKIRLISFALNARFEFDRESITIISRGC